MNLNQILHEIGFTQLKNKYCCYILPSKEDFSILVVICDLSLTWDNIIQ